MPKLLVLGDDLTGSNATGALYARFGLRAVSVNAPLAPDAPCLRAEAGSTRWWSTWVPATRRHHTPHRRCGKRSASPGRWR